MQDFVDIRARKMHLLPHRVDRTVKFSNRTCEVGQEPADFPLGPQQVQSHFGRGGQKREYVLDLGADSGVCDHAGVKTNFQGALG